MRLLSRSSALDDRVRKTLVDTLYTQPSNLVAGAACGLICAWGGALAAEDATLTVLATALSAVAVIRIVMAVQLPRVTAGSTLVRETLYEIGAFTYSGLCGLLAATAVSSGVPTPALAVLMGNAIAYGVSIAARNAGRPVIAIGQTVLALAPLTLACALRPELPFRLLALALALTVPAMASITLSTFRVLRDSIAAAETATRLADKMQHLARTDVVTGLFNRAGLNHHLVERVTALRPAQKLALFWLDLDRFKEVNDTLGHQVGDRLLAEVAVRLRNRSPKGACVARFGGDEFVVACEVEDRRAAQQLAMGMLEDITRPVRIDDDRLEIGSSIGIALMPDDGSDLDAVMQAADLALYHAKVNGRKQLSFFDPSMTRNLMRRKEIEAELRLALQRDELSIFFQPIVDLETGRIRAFESLVRWFHPQKGELRPDEFIPVAEETGAIITLGNWITAQAARVAAGWPDDVTLAVNLSPLQIRAPGSAMAILQALKDARLDPRRLELEVTETVLLDHSANTEAFMAELSEAGVRFALDDFGTGYSSLSYLQKYPFSKIKVDRSFVSGENAGEKSDAIIRAVSGMASTLRMELVAEGLETIEQVRAVRDAGCTLGQGFYFSRAVPDYLANMLLAQERGKLLGKGLRQLQA
ncbi:MAG: EAL domain-containing protein [Sphingomonadales bacterium]|nr:EAL domain-containing protein [Sphingomonadales bacterium]